MYEEYAQPFRNQLIRITIHANHYNHEVEEGVCLDCGWNAATANSALKD